MGYEIDDKVYHWQDERAFVNPSDMPKFKLGEPKQEILNSELNLTPSEVSDYKSGKKKVFSYLLDEKLAETLHAMATAKKCTISNLIESLLAGGVVAEVAQETSSFRDRTGASGIRKVVAPPKWAVAAAERTEKYIEMMAAIDETPSYHLTAGELKRISQMPKATPLEEDVAELEQILANVVERLEKE